MDYDRKKAAGDTPRARRYRELLDLLGPREFTRQCFKNEGEVMKLRMELKATPGGGKVDISS